MMVVMAGKRVKAAEVKIGISNMIREIIRKRGHRRISGCAFNTSGQGIPARAA
jgi:hypothetical protein